MSPTRFSVVVPLLAALASGCSAGGASGSPTLVVGTEGTGGASGGPAGSGSTPNIDIGDASTSTAFSAHIEQNHVKVEVVTLRCAGDCADVVAVPSGGQAPYTFVWEDGSTAPARHLCAASAADYHVAVTDAGIDSVEFRRAPETVEVPLRANVLECPEGGIGGGVPADGGDLSCTNSTAVLPRPGHYSGNLICPASTSSGGAAGSTGTLVLDLAAYGTGTLFFQWSLAVIGAQATIHGAECNMGQLVAAYDGQWGVPGFPDPNNPKAPPGLIPTGPITGTFTFAPVAGSPSSIAGAFNWDVPPVANAAASICRGSYTADLQP